MFNSVPVVPLTLEIQPLKNLAENEMQKLTEEAVSRRVILPRS